MSKSKHKSKSSSEDSKANDDEYIEYIKNFDDLSDAIIKIKGSIDELINQLQILNNRPEKQVTNSSLILIDNFFKTANFLSSFNVVDELKVKLRQLDTLKANFNQIYPKKKGNSPLKIEKPYKSSDSSIIDKKPIPKAKLYKSTIIYHEGQTDKELQDEFSKYLNEINQNISKKEEEERKIDQIISKKKEEIKKLTAYLKDIHSDYNNIQNVYEILENGKKNIQNYKILDDINEAEKDISKMDEISITEQFNTLVANQNFNISIHYFTNLIFHIKKVDERQFQYMIDLFKYKKSQNKDEFQIIFSYLTDMTIPMFEKISNLEGFSMEYLSTNVLKNLCDYTTKYYKLFKETEDLFKLNEKIYLNDKNRTKENENQRRNHLMKAKANYYNIKNLIYDKIEIYDETENIEDGLLHGFEFHTLVIPECVKSIGQCSFYFCQQLKTIDLRCVDLEEIGRSAFSGCICLEKFKMPRKIKVINEYTFKRCKNLKEIEFSDSLEEIKNEAFDECSSLTKVELKKAIKQIGVGAFKKCKSLKYFEIPGILEIRPSKDKSVFDDDEEEEENDDNKNYVDGKKEANADKYDREKEKKKNKKEAHDDDDDDDDDEDEDDHKAHKPSDSEKAFCISEKCFSKCDAIQNVTIKSGCQIVDKYAFASCPSIIMLEVNLINESTIETAAFQNCRSLKNVNFKVTEKSSIKIGKKSFENCSKLKEVNFDEPDLFESGKVKFEPYAFSGCKNITSFKFPPNSDGDIGRYCFNCCKKLKKVELPNSMTQISEGLFRNCFNLSDIKLNDAITIIHPRAFEECKQLILDKIPPKLTTIKSEAFKKCTLLKILSSIQKHSEEGYDEVLNVIEFPETLTTIENNAFEECCNFDALIIQKNMNKIQKNAFRGCQKLKKVTIYSANLDLEEKVFSHCKQLTSFETPTRKAHSPEVFYECPQKIQVTII